MRPRFPFKLLAFALMLSVAPNSVAAAPGAPVTFELFEKSVSITKKAMMGDPVKALASAKRAMTLAERLPAGRRKVLALATARWLTGEALIFLDDAVAATPIVNAALKTAERFAPNTKLHGDTLRSHGSIAAISGRPLDALRAYQRAYNVFQRANEPRSRALTLQDIALIYYDAGDYFRVLDYSRQAEEAYPRDPMLTLTLRNNRGEAYRQLRKYDLAAIEIRAALTQARKLGQALLLTRLYANLASLETQAGHLTAAKAAINQAVRLVAVEDATSGRSIVFGAAAEVAVGYGDFVQAELFLRRTFEDVDLEQSDMGFREHHRVAARVYEERGNSALALRHVKAFQRLNTEAQKLTASVASQLMAARFDFANQDLQISKLKQDQLSRAVEAERDRSRFRTIMFSGLLIAAAFVFGLLLFGYFALRRSRDAVAAANDTLTGVNGALEKALKARTEFLATTSHEIRTPLNGILGMTQVLLADRGVAPAVRERIQVVHGAGETMKALVDDILDVAKMESGRLTVASEPTHLHAILGDAARLWSGQAQAKGLELVLDIAGAPRRLMSDGGRLRQIVFNLMSNALKFTAEGRVTLFGGVERAEDGAERLAIRVADTGIGIPPDQQDAVFEAFKQVDGGTTRQFGGTGLGLAICKQLALALGGDVTVASAVGRGTSFDVLLPLVRAEPEAVAADEPEGDAALADARMLLLDRNPVYQGVTRVLLCAEAGHVAVADTAADALAALAGPDAPTHLLLDAASVAEDGVDLLATLRDLTRAARAAGAKCSLLLAPAAAGITVAEAMAVGAEQLIVKPIGAADLMTALRSLYGDEPDGLVAPDLFGAPRTEDIAA